MTMTLSKKRNQAVQAKQKAPSPEQLVFEDLFQQHWSRLCGLLFRLVGDWDEAQDLALDAFMKLYSQPPADEHNPGGWLYRVGMNLGFNALRARQRRQRYEEKAGVQALEAEHPSDPAEELESAQEREQVRSILAAMKPREAQTLILRHSGLSYAEIAAVLDVSPASVGTLIARAEREFEQRYTRIL